MDQSNAIEQPVFLKVEELNLTVPEAESILRALRGGEVDGLLVAGEGGQQVYMLSGAEHPYRVLIETMSEGAVTLTDGGRITYCNRGFAEMVGSTSKELIGSSIFRLVTDVKRLETLLASSESAHKKDEIAIKAAGGQSVPTLFSVSPLHLDETKSLCIVVTDLTDQKSNQELEVSTKLERSLREQAEKAKRNISSILESITDSYIALDRHWNITDVNERAATIFRRSRAELIGNNVWKLFPGMDHGEAYEAIQDAMANQRQVHFEAPSRVARGRWFEVHAYPSPEGLSVYMRDITERKRAEEERERLLTELSQTNRRKDEFLAMLSHELRNPLAPIANALEVLRRSGDNEPRLRSTTDVISRQVDDLARLIEDLLDASRITSGKVRIEMETVELSGVVSRAIETTRPLIEARKHRMTVSIPAEPVWLNADSTRIAQVLSNLLNNAAKYTQEGGDIELKAELEGNELVVRVRDTGVGIPEEILPHVFDMFTQADRSLDRSQGGLGIGLTLARSIVHMHGGAVQAFSAGRNRGSEFVVRLPVVSEPAHQQDETIDADPAPAIRVRRILVVDDNEDATETMALLLRLSGHEVEVASDGESALEAAEKLHPEIVLLDVGLPGMHGYEVAERLRNLPKTRNAIIVALTGYGQEQDRQRAKEAGFDYHFVKPVEFNKLESLLNSLSGDRSVDPTD